MKRKENTMRASQMKNTRAASAGIGSITMLAMVAVWGLIGVAGVRASDERGDYLTHTVLDLYADRRYDIYWNDKGGVRRRGDDATLAAISQSPGCALVMPFREKLLFAVLGKAGGFPQMSRTGFSHLLIAWVLIVLTTATLASNEVKADVEDALPGSKLVVRQSGKFRKSGERLEQYAVVEASGNSMKTPVTMELELEAFGAVSLGNWDCQGKKGFWLPVPDSDTQVNARLKALTDGGSKTLAETEFVLSGLSYFAKGNVSVIPASHNDIAILFTDDKTFEYRDKATITPALDHMKANKDYRFSMECTLYLMDYLRRRPEKKTEMQARMKEGRFEWGGTYTQPIESIYAGESLVRQVYLGRKWLKKTFKGCDTQIAMNADVPQRALQMSQILHKAGIKYMTLWRGFNEGFFNLASPDGSSVLCFDKKNFEIRTALTNRAQNWISHPYFKEVEVGLSPELESWGRTYRELGIPPEFPIVDWYDYRGPQIYDNEISARDSVARRLSELAGGQELIYPSLRYSTFTELFERVAPKMSTVKTFMGSRQCPWYYDQGPGHHREITACREAASLLCAAEKFTTIDALLSDSLQKYPTQEFSDAWEAQIYIDHGWGGYVHDQDQHDEYFGAKLYYAQDRGRQLLDRALASIAGEVNAPKDRGLPIVVFNALSWKRTDPVVCAVDVVELGWSSFRIVDKNGREVPHEILPVESVPGNRATSASVVFIATDVPPIGYKTYYVVPGPSTLPAQPPADTLENRFYRVQLCPGGVKSIYDKELGRELLSTGKFVGSEMFTMHSEGTGPFGDMGGYHLPTMEGFEKLSTYKPEWMRAKSGPVRTVYEFKHPTPHCYVLQRIILYRELKRIDFEASLLGWDGTPWREYRLAFPLNMEEADIAYEVPFGVDEVGKTEAVGSEDPPYARCDKDDPRILQDWINASDSSMGVTLSSSVAVFGFVDPSSDPNQSPMLQPLLLATRMMGKIYTQEGNHHYRFSLTSHQPGWRNGYRFGNQVNNPLMAVVVTGTQRGQRSRALPEERSFCSVEGTNVIVSTIKKCEDDDSVIIRCYEIEGKDTQATIRLPFPIAKAELTNIIEEEGESIPSRKNSVSLRVGHNAIETVKLILHPNMRVAE